MVEIKNYGAKGDGITNDTAAVQTALDSGEVVHFTAGTYLCGTLYMRSNGGIHLDEDAVLLAIPGKENYNADDFSPRNRVSIKEHASGAHFIIAEDCENISITGKGTISGNYKAVFDLSQVDSYSRPHYAYPEWRMAQMIFIFGCKNVTIKDVFMCDPQYWTCFLLDCDNVDISRVKIRADRLGDFREDAPLAGRVLHRPIVLALHFGHLFGCLHPLHEKLHELIVNSVYVVPD